MFTSQFSNFSWCFRFLILNFKLFSFEKAPFKRNIFLWKSVCLRNGCVNNLLKMLFNCTFPIFTLFVQIVTVWKLDSVCGIRVRAILVIFKRINKKIWEILIQLSYWITLNGLILLFASQLTLSSCFAFFLVMIKL